MTEATDDVPADVQVDWDHDGLTAVLPAELVAPRGEIPLRLLASLAVWLGVLGAGAWAWAFFAPFTDSVGVALVAAVSSGLTLAVGGLWFVASEQDKQREVQAPLTVRVVPHGTVSVRLGEVALLAVATHDIWSAQVSLSPSPHVVLGVIGDGGPMLEYIVAVRSEAHARWLQSQIEAARAQSARRDGSSEDVPSELAALRNKPRVPEGS